MRSLTSVRKFVRKDLYRRPVGLAAMRREREPYFVEDIVFFDMGGYMLALFPREELALDATVDPQGNGFSGVALAHNVREKGEVAEFLGAEPA